MVGLYKDPKGEDIFTRKSEDISLGTTTIGTTTGGTGTTSTNNEATLLRKIKELEDQLKEKDVCVCMYNNACYIM